MLGYKDVTLLDASEGAFDCNHSDGKAVPTEDKKLGNELGISDDAPVGAELDVELGTSLGPLLY